MKIAALFASFSSLAAAICHYGTALSPRTDLFRRAEGVFGYNELQGPLNWHGLSSENMICAMGKNQSPINVVAGEIKSVRGSSFGFKATAYPKGAEFENLGTGVQVYVNGSATVGGKAYSLQQFHFHTPSEHHVGGEYYPMEVHFVFQADDKSLAVIGFLIDIAGRHDSTDCLISSALRNVGDIPNAGDITTTGALDFRGLQSHLSRSNVFTYDGSLTTPPCSEGISFNVVANPLFVDVATFRAVKSVVKFNSRYTQNAPGQINLLDNARNVLNGAP